MKRLITTAGLAALGAASVAPACAQDAMINQKPWSIGASLRGFYDDNYNTLPRRLRDAPGYDDNTFGFDIAPTAAVNLKKEQTTFGLSYLYTFRYYIDRESPRDDQSHQVNLKLSHAFNERFTVDLKDSFVIAQEPAVIDPAFITYPARAEGDNMRNAGTIQLNATIVDNFSMDAGYNNSYYDYEQDGSDLEVGSRSATLDRIEHGFFMHGNYQLMPKTTLSLGYRFDVIDYTSEDLFIGRNVIPQYPAGVFGAERDNRSHTVTLGVKQHVNPQLDVSAEAGVTFTQYDNQVLFDDDMSPYASASVRWAYMQGSSLNAGVKHMRVATDVRLVDSKAIADQQATLFWLSVNQAITSKITAIVMGQYQHSTYGDSTVGGVRSLSDNLFFAGATVAYQFNPHIAAEAGYTYDRLDSDLFLRSFTRNRIYVGTRFNY
jgi:hypothetical protein